MSVEEKIEEQEISVETPEEETPKEASSEEVDVVEQEKTEEPKQEDELDSYSKGVQSRIKKLTEKYRQEERDKSEAVRLSQELIEENKKLRQELEKSYISNFIISRDSKFFIDDTAIENFLHLNNINKPFHHAKIS